MKFLYRYEDVQYAPPVNEWDEPVGEGRVVVYLYSFPVVRRTPKGAWICGVIGKERFVRLDARKRFACPTIEEARKSFVARKKAQLRIYEAMIHRVEKALATTLPTEPFVPIS